MLSVCVLLNVVFMCYLMQFVYGLLNVVCGLSNEVCMCYLMQFVCVLLNATYVFVT